MHISSVVLWLSLGVLVKDAAASDWCYTDCEHSPSHWKDLPRSFCDGHEQSPIDIIPSLVMTDPELHDFTLVNFDNQHIIKSFTNNGHTVKCILEENEVEVSGGGLNGTYSAVQFHFHWGNTEHHPGSEHTVDEQRYPMEMHIVSLKKGMTAEEAQQKPDGFAVLGFFINESEDGQQSEAWDMLTSYLHNITEVDEEVEVNHTISINDLIGDVNLTKFYRYMGSLTTPNCNEAVVWTIFQEPISVKRDVIDMFPTLTKNPNVYRPTQPLHGRPVYASPATPLLAPASHSWCYDDHCDHNPTKWHLLPDSHCDGESQSPIDISTTNVEVDENLAAFEFTHFDDQNAIKYITNTGHAVTCVMHNDLVEVKGGGLEHVYSTLQFHFHWGDESQDSEGSEHMVDSKRYPMEMHIVNKRKDLTLEDALQTPDGLAVLGFFIEILHTSKRSSHDETPNPTSSPAPNMEPWMKLISYLSNISEIDSKVNVKEEISIDDLLGSVNRESYYRYRGSLTTPSCNEAVVWTVFKETVKVDHELMVMFPRHAGYHNVYRPAQSLHDRKIHSTRDDHSSSASNVQQDIFFYLLLACLCVLFR